MKQRRKLSGVKVFAYRPKNFHLGLFDSIIRNSFADMLFTSPQAAKQPSKPATLHH
jgi:hypothetical protein